MEAGLKIRRRGYNMRGGAYIWEAGLKANLSAHTEKTEPIDSPFLAIFAI